MSLSERERSLNEALQVVAMIVVAVQWLAMDDDGGSVSGDSAAEYRCWWP